MRDESDTVTRAVAARLARRRRDLGLSLADVAHRCGVSLQQIHRYETAENTISVAMLWQLSRCLGVDVGWFFEELEAEQPVG